MGPSTFRMPPVSPASAGLYMLGNHVDALYDDLVLLRAYLKNLALFALVFA